MKRCISSSRRVSIAVLATAIVTLSGSVFAQSVDQVLQAELRRLNLAQQSQERINNIVEGTRSLEDQYRAINKEIDGLRVYNRLMMAQTEGQKAVLEDISLSMDQVDVINRQIFPLMERMIDGLEQSVALDVPFLMEERSARIDNLKEIMERSDVSHRTLQAIIDARRRHDS
jgi:methyl-accepting chemotaxis protein